MMSHFLKNSLDKKEFKIFKILIFFLFVLIFFQLVLIQGKAKDFRYKIENPYLEIQENSGFQSIPLARKENGKEEVVGNFKMIDDYLISDIPENEFLEKYSYLNSGFKDLKINIESDQPIFRKENFRRSKSLFQKIEFLFSGEELPDYRLTKNISHTPVGLETKFGIPGFNLKTSYEEKEGKIKQSLVLENNSDKEINLQLSLIHSIEADQISFGGKEYNISEIPQLLSLKEGKIISFSAGLRNNYFGQRFNYDFSDLSEFNPEIWIFKKDSENSLLIKISFSLLPHSSKIIDPAYQVDTTTGSTATAYGFQRKTWHDGSRYWVSFWSDADNRIEFWYSSTSNGGVNWTENTLARISRDTNDFSINCDSTNCFIVYASGTKYISARRASLYPATGFTWSGESVVASSSTNTLKNVHLSKSIYGYLYVVYTDAGLGSTLYVKKSTNINSVTSWGSATTLDTYSASNVFYGLTVPTANGTDTMLAIFNNDKTLKSKTYNGTSWSTASTTIDYLYSASGFDDNFSAIYDDTNYGVHLLYNASGSTDSYIKYRKYDSVSAAWGASTTIASSTVSSNDYVSISIDRENKNLYAFWINYFPSGDGYTVYYSTSASSYTSWSSASSLYSTTSVPLTWLTSNYYPYSGTENDLFVEFLATSSGYRVLFSKIDGSTANSAPTVGTVIFNGGKNINLTENTTTMIIATATVSDANGYSDIASVTGRFYTSGAGSNCSADDNTCYVINSCATSSCSGDSCTATCQANMWFHANPTDDLPFDYWLATIKAIDKSNASSSANSSATEVNTLHALAVSSVFERYNEGDDNYQIIGGTTWLAQTFTIGNTGVNTNHNIINLKLKIGRQGSPGTSTLSIKATDSNGAPTSTDLVSVEFNGNNLNTRPEWVTFSFFPYQLNSSTKYAIVLRAPDGNVLVNFLKWADDESSPTYSGGSSYSSDNSGSTWGANTKIDFMFEEYGEGGKINYGNLGPGENTGTLNQKTIITTTGNAAIDIYLYGTNLEKE